MDIKEIGLWDRFEEGIINTQEYKDPYRDVELQVIYKDPDGEEKQFWGFYDGDTTWKFRFMPNKTGLWTYRAYFSDGSGEKSGTFNCIPSDIPGLISTEETNPLWFGFKGGNHILIRSLHVGDRFFASNWDHKDREKFLDWVTENKYNTLSIASHYLNRAVPGRGQGWETPQLWKDSSPQAAEYEKMELILNELVKRRIIVFPFAGFFGKDSCYPTQPEDQVLYIKYTLARIGAYWNVVFNVAGPEPLHRKATYLKKEDVNRLGRLISGLDIFGHMLTVHNRDEGEDDFKEEDYITFSTVQGIKTTNRHELNIGLLKNRKTSCPIYAQETLWSNNFFHPDYTDDDIRKNAYVIMMSAAALNFADNNGDSSSGFSGTLDIDKAVQSRHDILKMVWDFFESIPYYRMKPRQDLVNRGCCLAEDNVQYLVYLESGGAVDVKLPKGSYKLLWINARNTSDIRQEIQIDSGIDLNAPDRNDWLLYIKRID